MVLLTFMTITLFKGVCYDEIEVVLKHPDVAQLAKMAPLRILCGL